MLILYTCSNVTCSYTRYNAFLKRHILAGVVRGALWWVQVGVVRCGGVLWWWWCAVVVGISRPPWHAGHAFSTSNAWNRPREGKGRQCLKPSRHVKAYQQDMVPQAF